jgi:integrase
VTGLKAADIDGGRMVIRVERGKGGKERYVMSSEQALGIRRSYRRFAQARTVFVSGS